MLSRKTIRTVQDTLHRGFVYTSIGVTIIAGIALAQISYNLITKGRPSHRLAMLQSIQETEDMEMYTDEFPSSSVKR